MAVTATYFIFSTVGGYLGIIHCGTGKIEYCAPTKGNGGSNIVTTISVHQGNRVALGYICGLIEIYELLVPPSLHYLCQQTKVNK